MAISIRTEFWPLWRRMNVADYRHQDFHEKRIESMKNIFISLSL
jgi:hypothetical protein